MPSLGLDEREITAWLRDRTPLEPPFHFRRIEGGRSNLTYAIQDCSGRHVVLRRPPLHGVLASAHDVLRECRIMRALGDSGVPVPTVIDHEDDPSVTGAPFYVMEYVDGLVLRDADQARVAVEQPLRAVVSDHAVDALAQLHAVDPSDVSLDTLSRRSNYIGRQLRRWHRQLHQSRTRVLPSLEEAHRRLTAAIPDERHGLSLVHGDYRFDNLIVDPNTGRVAAVLDWELATLGDPLADLGAVIVYWAEPGDALLPLGDLPTRAEGFRTREEVAALYSERSGRDLPDLQYYVAFATWRLACILEGVHGRHARGAYGERPDIVERFRDAVPRLGKRALALLEGDDWRRW